MRVVSQRCALHPHYPSGALCHRHHVLLHKPGFLLLHGQNILIVFATASEQVVIDNGGFTVATVQWSQEICNSSRQMFLNQDVTLNS